MLERERAEIKVDEGELIEYYEGFLPNTVRKFELKYIVVHADQKCSNLTHNGSL